MITRILYPEKDRIIRKPLSIWLEDILEKYFIFLKTYKNEEEWQEKLLLIINQLSLICFYIGEPNLSSKICFSSLNFYSKRFSDFGEKKSLNCIFQPWINLVRLDRLNKRLNQSKRKIKTINPYNQSKYYYINKNKIPKKLIEKPNLKLLNYCYVQEKIKILISNNSSLSLINFIQYIDGKTENYKELKIEAKIISYFMQKKIELALEETILAKENCDSNFKDIFLLKLCEIIFFIDQQNKDFSKILLYLYEKYIINIETLNLSGLYFCFYICQNLKKAKLFNEAVNMLEKLIEKFKLINDEVCIIECLNLCSSMKNLYSKELNLLLKESYYFHLTNVKKELNLNGYLVKILLEFLSCRKL